MEGHIHGLEPVGNIFARLAGGALHFSLGGALQSQLRRKIEDDRQIGLRRADDSTVDGFDSVQRQPARRALIGTSRNR